MARQARRFTIYDAMEDKGVFEANSANVDSRDREGNSLYKGPVQYPKLMYHPKGQERIIVPASAEMTPFGPKMLGEQREIIHQVVNSKKEENELVSLGWHDHPAKAIAASDRVAEGLATVPPTSSGERVMTLEAQMAAMQAELDAAKAALASRMDDLKSEDTPKITPIPGPFVAGPIKVKTSVVSASSGLV